MPAYAAKPIPPIVRQRAHDRHTVDANGCWISDFYTSPNGYAHISMRVPKTKHDLSYLAHRASWEHVNGPAPAHMQIDHMCFTRNCVNPDHLRCVTHLQNAQRRNGKDFPMDGRCGWGHPESARRVMHYKRSGVMVTETRCGECLREKNAINAQRDAALKRLELAYGLTLTKAQQAMVDEFMPVMEVAA